MHPVDDKRYFEWWYFDSKLDDGHVIVGFIHGCSMITGKPSVEYHIFKPDGTELNASGLGYHDHNWGVGNMKRIIDYWYWGRLYTDRLTLLYAQVITQEGYEKTTKPLMLAVDDQIVLSSGEITLEEGSSVFSEVANRTYPSYIEMTIPGEVKLKLEVRDVIDAHDFVADIPVIGSRLVKPLANRLIGRPGYFRFNSEFTLSASAGGQDFETTGFTFSEMVALR